MDFQTVYDFYYFQICGQSFLCIFIEDNTKSSISPLQFHLFNFIQIKSNFLQLLARLQLIYCQGMKVIMLAMEGRHVLLMEKLIKKAAKCWYLM